jgi:hypothetical protein
VTSVDRSANRLVRRSVRRRVLAIVALAAVFCGGTTVAWSYWTGTSDPTHGAGVAGAITVDAGAAPTVETSDATTAVVRWGASTLSNGMPVDGYVVRRYNASAPNQALPAASGCAGVVTALSCTEANAPTGAWRYTVTPVFAGNWRGGESAKSGAVRVGSATLDLSETLFGAALPTTVAGSVTGFAPGESISFRVDGASVSGAPTTVDANGAATLTAVTIPTLTDGPHTVRVTGASSGLVASTGILVDATPPVLTTTVTPAPNAAGWNRTPVEVGGSGSDGNGSGLSYVKVTDDGSDPRTSPTAETYAGSSAVLTETTTLKFYGVDLAGNESDVQTLPVKIDMIAPSFVPEMVDVTGGAFVTVGPPEPGVAFYRGSDAGSFRFKITLTDEGGSGPASFGTAALIADQTGFTHLPGTSPTADGAAALTNPFSWTAGTTSTPTGTVTVTDAAGNTSVGGGTLHNDSVAPTGGSIAVTGLGGTGGRYSTSTSIALVLDRGSDAGSGLAASGAKLLRASAPLTSGNGATDGTCGTYGGFVQVGADHPAAATTDTVPSSGRCYRYSYVVPDNVGNEATYVTPDVKVQTTAPTSLTPTGVVITPVTGPAAQLVVGSTVYYKPGQTGSFTVAATTADAVSGAARLSFPTLAGFSGGGPVAPQGTGTTFRSTYGWSNNGASPSPGAQTLTATNNAGLSAATPSAFSVVADADGPTHALSLADATNAHFDAGRLYYNSNVSGSFRLVDALTDSGSGAASVSYPALALTGWTHAAETVETPAGGPYVSRSYSWTARPSNPSGYTIVGRDRLSTTSSAAVPFVADPNAPTGGSISYPAGVLKTLSVPITTTAGTDSGAGLSPTPGMIQRDQAPLDTATGACGTFPRTFATTVTLVDGADTMVGNARCYQYRYRVADNVGNVATYTSADVVKVDTTPKVTAISSYQPGGAPGDGHLQVGDQLVLTFDENLNPASVPTTFSGATEARTLFNNVTLNIPGITAGAVDTGSYWYLVGSLGFSVSATFGGTVVLSNDGDATTVTITVTSLSGQSTAVGNGVLRFVPAPTLTDIDGTGATGTFSTASGFRLF